MYARPYPTNDGANLWARRGVRREDDRCVCVCVCVCVCWRFSCQRLGITFSRPPPTDSQSKQTEGVTTTQTRQDTGGRNPRARHQLLGTCRLSCPHTSSAHQHRPTTQTDTGSRTHLASPLPRSPDSTPAPRQCDLCPPPAEPNCARYPRVAFRSVAGRRRARRSTGYPRPGCC